MATSNEELVEYLEREGYVETGRVREAFLAVDRAEFVPKERRDSAYTDRPLSIGGGSTISAPHMVAINTELLEVKEDSRVLEIGSGSGYQLAILAELAGEVHGVEIDPRLVEQSRDRLSGRENVEVQEGSGFEPVEGSFDRILYSCAVESLEGAKERLNQDGILVAPVETGSGQVLRRWKNDGIEEHGRVRFVPFQDGSER